MFEKSGLDLGGATLVRPDVPAPVDSDQRISWMARYIENPERTVRVDAAVLGGQIVWFDVVPPWRDGWRGDRLTSENVGSNPADVIVTLLIITALLGGLWVARRNLRRGRGDRRGALRLWFAIFLALSAASLLRADLVGGLPHIWEIITERIGLAGFRAATIAILYLAIEPYLRRRWPTLLVSWSRLLAGGWRDPLVGQHILLGVLGGIVLAILQALPDLLATNGVSPGSFQSALTSGRQALASAIQLATSGVLPPFVLSSIMVAIAVLFGRRWAGVAGVSALLLAVPLVGSFAAGDLSMWNAAAILMAALLVATVTSRLGLLAAFALFATSNLMSLPLTFDTSAFFFPSSAIALAFVLSFLAWGAFVAADPTPRRFDGLDSGVEDG